MSALPELVPAVQRTVAVPGTFEDLFTETVDADLAALLLDAFAEAQLDGWFPAHTATDLGVVSPDLTRADSAVIVLYASARLLAAEVRNRRTHIRYEAGGAVFEQDQSPGMLNELLREMNNRKIALRTQALRGNLTDAFVMGDLYYAKLLAPGW